MPLAARLDRDEPLPLPAETAVDDTGLHDLGDLWTDLGGSD
jgi:hypothetical protein